MTCKGVEIRLGAYMDGELSAAEVAAIRKHLAHCPTCAVAMEQERRIKLALANMNLMTPRPDFEERLISNVMGQSHRRRSLHTKSAYAVVALAASVLAFVVLSRAQEAKADAASKILAERSQRLFEIERHQTDLQASDPLSPGSGIILVNHEP